MEEDSAMGAGHSDILSDMAPTDPSPRLTGARGQATGRRRDQKGLLGMACKPS